VEELELLNTALDNPNFLVENVAAQDYLVQYLENQTPLNVEGFHPHGQDKRTRLALTSSYFQRGQVLFPRHGAEILITQLTGFGTERYKDLVDACVMALLKIIEVNPISEPMLWSSHDDPYGEETKPFTAGWTDKKW